MGAGAGVGWGGEKQGQRREQHGQSGKGNERGRGAQVRLISNAVDKFFYLSKVQYLTNEAKVPCC